MPKYSNVHLVLNSRDRILAGSSGTYNNFSVSNPGQNIVQGQIKDIALSEIQFPYDLPNVMPGFNNFFLIGDDPSFPEPYAFQVIIPVGFYTGTELAAAINTQIIAAATAAGVPTPATTTPTVTYDPTSNRFTFNAPSDPLLNQAWVVAGEYTFPTELNPPGYVPTPSAGKDLLSIMGFPNSSTQSGQIGKLNDVEICVSGSAPLVFTQYIDICSPRLCQYQFLRDGSTTSFPRRVDLICRLFVEDETSMPLAYDVDGNPIPVGTRPFVIHRQFKNQRVMRTTAANAINEVDIQLYDDCGQPLATAWNPRDYQITFHVYEGGDRESEANIGYRY